MLTKPNWIGNCTNRTQLKANVNYQAIISAQIGNVVTIQAASVQEQLQRIQQLREQQQKKKKQAAEAKKELAHNAANQSDIIQKQVSSIISVHSLSPCHQHINTHLHWDLVYFYSFAFVWL